MHPPFTTIINCPVKNILCKFVRKSICLVKVIIFNGNIVKKPAN